MDTLIKYIDHATMFFLMGNLSWKRSMVSLLFESIDLT